MQAVRQIRWPVTIIAEIGCNHKGDMGIAKEMIDIAASYCKVDAVKFQKRCNKELLSKSEYNSPHPNPHNSYGSTYGEHREYLEFSVDQHAELQEYADNKGIEYCTSVWDLTSAKEIAALKPNLIKIPSACNTDHRLLGWLLNEYAGEIHVSVGMTDRYEESNLVRLFENFNRSQDLVLYSCTSGYPVPFDDVCLLEINRLQKEYLYQKRCKAVGFSGHHLGIAVDAVAAALGAKVIERHFTLDRTWKGTDHSASLEPEGMRKLVRDVQAVKRALTNKSQEILPIEEVQRKKLKRLT